MTMDEQGIDINWNPGVWEPHWDKLLMVRYEWGAPLNDGRIL